MIYWLIILAVVYWIYGVVFMFKFTASLKDVTAFDLAMIMIIFWFIGPPIALIEFLDGIVIKKS